jgi:cysteine synthase A
METRQNVIELIGNTPLLKLNRIGKELNVNILVKLENLNPGASVKDRLALAMIRHAEENNLINQETEIIEPTSGNTGIGLAMICAVKGYKLTLTMPESMSMERRKILAAYGAKLELTPADKGMKGAITKAEELASSLKNAYIPYQFRNISNVEMHRRTTAMEIWAATGGSIDIFVAGVGTGGTFTGVVSKIREMKPDLTGIAVEPSLSPVLSGGEPGRHKIQGIGAGFIPEIMDTSIIDEILHINDEEAFTMARRLAREEGILAGISAGANVAAALKVAERPENAGKTVVTVICDTGERYLSSELFNVQ